MSKRVAIVIGYNRPAEALRLLQALSANDTDEPCDLIVSVDRGPQQADVAAMANAFQWPHGGKRVIQQSEHLGLKAHVLRCGDLITEYDYGLVFEEDLVVSRQALAYAAAVVAHYGEHERLAGFSLYSYHRREHDKLPFTPIDDGTDAYFAQFPSSWGQVYTRGQWARFRQWLAQNDGDHFDDPAVPRYVARWPASSWKKHFARYMIRTDRYFVFPRSGLSTNLGLEGANHTGGFNRFASPLLHGSRQWVFPALDDDALLYDALLYLPPGMRARFEGYLDCPDVDACFRPQGAGDFFAAFPLRAPVYGRLTVRAVVNDLRVTRAMLARWLRRRLSRG